VDFNLRSDDFEFYLYVSIIKIFTLDMLFSLLRKVNVNGGVVGAAISCFTTLALFTHA
jgi:hypothetical protein